MSDKGLYFQETAIKVFKQPGTPSNSITALTNANPSVATVTDHNLTSGDAIYLTSDNISGQQNWFLVDVIDENSFAVIGLDGTSIGTVTDAKFIKGDSFGFCETTDMKVTPYSVKFNDDTTVCDAYPSEYPTLEAGSISIGAMWSTDNGVQDYLEDLGQVLGSTFVVFKPKSAKTIRGFVCALKALNIQVK
ncbi:hypothetical protein [Snodgrassella sp. CFCC 13594]|uniref:hypothetical protein n=1 Tax=Snodgrassella sp. CFCC 13594 TaxID=1775559 RepID=UPI000B27E641|nr:hypothetical protein [Snodgrassella sp. CFCC 13594]